MSEDDNVPKTCPVCGAYYGNIHPFAHTPEEWEKRVKGEATVTATTTATPKVKKPKTKKKITAPAPWHEPATDDDTPSTNPPSSTSSPWNTPNA